MARKKDGGMRQSALRLPPDLHQRLRRAGGEGGMGEEIRRRLEASFEAEKAPKNPKTKELLDAFSFIVKETERYYGDWTDPWTFEVLKVSVEMLFTAIRPEGEAVPKPDPNPHPPDPRASGFVSVFYDPDSSPKEPARYIVGELLHRERIISRGAKREDEGKRR
jgi:hypothetical protein